VQRFDAFLRDVVRVVTEEFDGSLKAEHGTGRNMAPFVEKEWGADAYQLMQAIKAIFDPAGLLNPGVILNPNPSVHLENLKPLPAADPLIDVCMECGFCECHCPSRNLSLTPRQRIVIQREIARLDRSGENPARLGVLTRGYAWQGEATCAADSLCAVACPVDVDTGKYTKTLRSRQHTSRAGRWLADQAADYFGPLTAGIRNGLRLADRLHRTLGAPAMQRLTAGLRRLSGNRLPVWLPSLPTAADPPRGRTAGDADRTVVYFPACVSRTMGPAAGDPLSDPLYRVTERVLRRAGYRVVYPRKMERLCCGLPFESKGFFGPADARRARADHQRAAVCPEAFECRGHCAAKIVLIGRQRYGFVAPGWSDDLALVIDDPFGIKVIHGPVPAPDLAMWLGHVPGHVMSQNQRWRLLSRFAALRGNSTGNE
jgi:D-lactate dehydrogenase